MMKHKQIKSKNGIVHYWISINTDYNAKCIVFTHGLTANHEMFEKQISYFSKNYIVITWDVPLHGLSRPYSDFSYENTAKELNAILETENIQKVILVGMSMGGYPSQEFAIQYHQKVIGFIAVDTTPFGLCYYSKADMWWLRKTESIAKCFPDNLLRKSMAKSVSKTQYSYNMMIKMLKPLSKMEIAEQMGIAYGTFIKENKNVCFEFPVLILVGDSDKTGKVKKYCENWSKKEGYPLHIVKNAAHFSNADNSEQVNSEIQNFIYRLCE